MKMEKNKELDGFGDFNFTKKIRILNVLVYVLIIFFGNVYKDYVLLILSFYTHMFLILLFLILELRYVILTKKGFFKHIFTNWLVLFGFIILTFDLTKIFLKIDFLKIILGKN